MKDIRILLTSRDHWNFIMIISHLEFQLILPSLLDPYHIYNVMCSIRCTMTSLLRRTKKKKVQTEFTKLVLMLLVILPVSNMNCFDSIFQKLTANCFLIFGQRDVMDHCYLMIPPHLRGKKMRRLTKIQLEALRLSTQSRLLWRKLAHPQFLVLIY